MSEGLAWIGTGLALLGDGAVDPPGLGIRELFQTVLAATLAIVALLCGGGLDPQGSSGACDAYPAAPP